MSRKYYKVISGSDVDKGISEFNVEFGKILDSWLAFAKKYNSTNFYANNKLSGLMYEDSEPPAGWISTQNMHPKAFKPARKKICMDAYKEINELKSKPDGHRLSKILNIAPIFSSMAMHFPTFEEIGGTFILSLHSDMDAPEGVNEMKESEYWEMKESV